jgi:histidinol-phosphate aminotransferase
MPNLVKLNTNESPFGSSPQVQAAIKADATDTLRLYPDPQSTKLRAAIASRYKVAPEQVFVGNGSDEVLAHTFAALLDQAQPVRFPDITYSFYPVYCRLWGIEWQTVPLDAGMRINVDDYIAHPGPVIFANPNAPTGIALSCNEIVRLVEARSESVVVIDEAYVDFGAESMVPFVASHPNLLIIQTMSKSRALAGLRVGYAIGHVDQIQALSRVKDSFNSYPLGHLSQAGAIASLADDTYFAQSCAEIIGLRAYLTQGLIDLGFDVLPSSANFVFVRHPQQSAALVAKALRQRAVLVRHFKQPRISDYLRISVGTKADLDRLIAALTAIISP